MEGIDWWMTLSLFVEVRFSNFFSSLSFIRSWQVTCDLASCLLVGNRFREECSASLQVLPVTKFMPFIEFGKRTILTLKRTCVVFVLQPILDLVTKEMPAYDDIIRAMCNEKVQGVLIYHYKWNISFVVKLKTYCTDGSHVVKKRLTEFQHWSCKKYA